MPPWPPIKSISVELRQAHHALQDSAVGVKWGGSSGGKGLNLNVVCGTFWPHLPRLVAKGTEEERAEYTPERESAMLPGDS